MELMCGREETTDGHTVSDWADVWKIGKRRASQLITKFLAAGLMCRTMSRRADITGRVQFKPVFALTEDGHAAGKRARLVDKAKATSKR